MMSDQDSGPTVGAGGVQGTEIGEREAWSANGLVALILVVVCLVTAVALIRQASVATAGGAFILGALVALVVCAVLMSTIKVVSPGDTRVLLFFGGYKGTIRHTGLRMSIPFAVGRRVSVKVGNFETEELKVNDADGNPINIAAVVVWRVADTAKAVFAVERYDAFVQMQAEAALRHVATSHPYDNAAPGEESLRGSTDLVSAELAEEVSQRIAIAGLDVVETRVSSLAYAPEIAHAMLQRQQAAAVIAAREKIVDGAVSMVESALRQLELDEVVTLDEERKAAMVSNLLVVLCGSAQATPVVNTGTLYT